MGAFPGGPGRQNAAQTMRHPWHRWGGFLPPVFAGRAFPKYESQIKTPRKGSLHWDRPCAAFEINNTRRFPSFWACPGIQVLSFGFRDKPGMTRRAVGRRPRLPENTPIFSHSPPWHRTRPRPVDEEGHRTRPRPVGEEGRVRWGGHVMKPSGFSRAG
jgi:hypothetical protein